MPLFRWKKTRRYEVSSRSSYVVCVHLLDTKLIECTLTADSCGLECLENIAQRIELNQCEYFGLRYVNKKLQFRWVELDKPLKKQLDKNAHSPLLYFGVMFYVPDAQSIQDDMTRYQYYLQLKSDIIDGRLACSSDKAVLLAAYSVQAELGDYDYERHTVENLKEVVLLPRSMTVDDRSLAELTQDVINHHQTLLHWSAAMAEAEYILEAQQLEGYGMDYYSAKDHSGREVLLGAYYAGVFVKIPEKPATLYKWPEVAHFSYSKKHFSILTPLKEKPIQFTMDDPDTAKYIYKLFSLQMSFFTGRIANTSDLDNTAGSRTPDLTDSLVEARSPNNVNTSPVSVGMETSVGTASPGSPIVGVSPMQFTQNNVQEDPSITILNTPSAIATANDAVYYSNGHIYPVAQGEEQQPSQQRSTTPHQVSVPNSPPYVRPSPLPLHSNSFVATTTTSPVPPSYRHTPDYETVMRQRVEQMAQVQQQQRQISPALDPQLTYLSNIINSQVYAHPDTLSYSQPEIHHMHHAQQPSHMGQYQFNTDLSTFANGSAMFNGGGGGGGVGDASYASPSHHYPLRPVDRTSSLIIYPTYATQEVTSKSSLANHAQFSTSEHLLNELVYKPPPPYARSSNSTPDLASQTRRTLVSSSPDLISRRHLQNNTGLMVHSFLDQSVENLAADSGKITLTQRSAAQSKQNLDDASSIQSEVPQFYLHQAGSIPDVAHSAMMSQDYAHGVGPVTYSPPTGHPAAHRVVTPTTGILSNHGNRDSSRSMPHQQNYELANQQAPDYAYTGPIAFDNPAFRDNLPAYLREVQAYQNNEAAVAQSVTNHVVAQQPTVSKAPPVADPQTTTIVMRNKKNESPNNNAVKQSSPCDTTPENNQLEDAPMSKEEKRLSIGALKMAALNGLTLSRGSVLEDETPDSSPEEAPHVPKDERRRQLEAKLAAGQVFAEFERVEKKRLKSECSAASQPMNRERNRFKDVLPYDDNRVKLTPTKENPMGYINASDIKLHIGSSELWYVAAQGPLSTTVHDFWQMVWEQEVEVIAMLTKLQEHGRPKCHRYWPERVGPKHKVQHAQYQVVMKFSNDAGPYTTSGLLVKHLPSNRERLVWHLQYTDWPDHGCPDDVFGFLGFLDEVEAIKRQTQMEKTDSRKVPILVHCSAGVGRTGVVLLTEAIKACLEHNQNVDVPGMLAKLREQRMYTVQTVSQYSFVYDTLVQYLRGSRLI